MFLMNNDFYDLSYLIVFFRNYTTSRKNYIPALENIIEYVEKEQTDNGIECNAIRHILAAYCIKDDKNGLLHWAFVENEYTAHSWIMKNQIHYNIISDIFSEIIISLNESHERTFSVCDVTHNIPELLAEEKKSKKIILSMIKNYRKEYNNDFLNESLNKP